MEINVLSLNTIFKKSMHKKSNESSHALKNDIYIKKYYYFRDETKS